MQFLAALSDASRETLIWWAAAVIVFGLTEVIKIPIKRLTAPTITVANYGTVLFCLSRSSWAV